MVLHSADSGRRHDLDALRAFAMLLGIALHATLSFAQFPWAVQDIKQDEAFHLFFFAVHGFRMPLFFLLSGFFTAMLWQKRGLASLLVHRTKRILLPLLLGLVTVVPATNWVSTFVAGDIVETLAEDFEEKVAKFPHSESDDYLAKAEDANPQELRLLLELAARRGDVDGIAYLIGKGADIDAVVQDLGAPLHWAAVLGHVEAVEYLIGQGANLDVLDRENGTPLHWAAFFGQSQIVELLVEKGANLNIVHNDGNTPLDAVADNWSPELGGIVIFIASLLSFEVDLEEVESGRPLAREILEGAGAEMAAKQEGGNGADELLWLLFLFPIFHHLWFLWFLCWLVAFFVFFSWIRTWLPNKATPRWVLLLMAVGLVVLTFGPQSAMRDGGNQPGFGPDTSLGLLPYPHLLAYYGIFFFFGAIYFKIRDVHGQLGKFWWISLPLALVVIFPTALWLAFDPEAVLSMDEDARRGLLLLLEATFTWLMIFGCIGLFQKALAAGNRFVRYLSDASYWLYLTHVPLVILLQWCVKDWDFPVVAKFLIVCAATVLPLLVAYDLGVRYTWLGTLLNGPRSSGKKA